MNCSSRTLMRGRVLAWAAMLLTPVTLSSPAMAQSQSCDLLRARMSGVSGDLFGIAQDYPKTHLAIVSCMMSQNTDQDRGGCAIAVNAAACLGMGSAYCDDLTSRWQQVANSYQAIASQMRALGCRQ